MKIRVIAAIVLLPLLLIVVLALPKIYTAILIGLMAAVGAYELMRGTGLVTQPRLLIYAMAAAFLVPLWSHFGMQYVWALVGILAYCGILFGEMLLSHAKLAFKNLGISLVAGIVLPFFLSALVRLHGDDKGRFLILIPFVIAFLSDTGAYFAGRFLGKHKLSPVVSPNKTVEGVVGGVFAAILGMLIFCMVLQIGFKMQVKYYYASVYGLVGSMAAVFGDLSFSAIKRQVGIKDYGNLIPGHGGILDRFDSMMMVAPLVEALMILLPVVV